MKIDLASFFQLLLYYILHPFELPQYYFSHYYKLSLFEILLSFVLYCALLYFFNKYIKNKGHIFKTLLAIYIVFLIQITILGREFQQGERVNFWGTYYLLLFYDFKHSLINILINIGLFIPFGCFLKDKRFTYVLETVFIFTLFIEVTQLITSRGTFEMCDIIHNLLGAIIGYRVCNRKITRSSKEDE